MKQTRINATTWRLEAEGEGTVLLRPGDPGNAAGRVVLTADPALWEEAQAPAYTKAEYDAEVERLVAGRYTLGQEIQVNREAAERPGEFAAYMAYLADCKARARENLEAGVRDQALGVRN